MGIVPGSGRASTVAAIGGLVLSALALASVISSLFGRAYTLTDTGAVALFGLASLASITTLVGVERRHHTWRPWMTVPCAAFAIAFGFMWHPYWIPVATAIVVLGWLWAASRGTRHRGTIAALSITSVVSLALGVASIGLGIAWSEIAPEIVDRGAVSPNGALEVEYRSTDPGAMGSTRVDVSVVPRFLPILEKHVYLGGAELFEPGAGGVRWKGNDTLVVNYRDVQILGPIVYSSQFEAAPPSGP